MEMIIIISACSIISWYIIDRLKPIWANVSFGNYITMAVAALFGFALAFGLKLDILYALGIYEEITIYGLILTGLTFIGGSSAISEIIEKLRDINNSAKG